MVSRLTAQKGLDLVLAAAGAAAPGAQLAVQGSGDPVLEAAFNAAHANPGQVALRAAYDEAASRTASSRVVTSSSCPRASSPAV